MGSNTCTNTSKATHSHRLIFRRLQTHKCTIITSTVVHWVRPYIISPVPSGSYSMFLPPGSHIICGSSIWRIKTWRHRNRLLRQRIIIPICHHVTKLRTLEFFFNAKKKSEQIIYMYITVSELYTIQR